MRCFLLNVPRGPNLAYSRESLSGARLPRITRLYKQTFSQRPDRITLACWRGIRLGGLVSARRRLGRRVWEVDYLYLPALENTPDHHHSPQTDEHESTNLGLLEHLVQAIGQRQGERIFLRAPFQESLICLARQAGFFPVFEESLMARPVTTEHRGQTAVRDQQSAVSGPWSVDPIKGQDDHSLFQLFCAATPSTVRSALGVTFDQWKDAREPSSHRRKELAARMDDKIVGWLSLQSRRNMLEGEVMVHPDQPDLLIQLIDLALSKGSAQRWLVPDYQEVVNNLLLRHGFHQTARYTLLAKTVAARVSRHGMVPVEA